MEVRLNIQGEAPDGHMLVVCDWPNLCAVPVPEAKQVTIEKILPVKTEYRTIEVEATPPMPLPVEIQEDNTLWWASFCGVIVACWMVREWRLWHQRKRR